MRKFKAVMLLLTLLITFTSCEEISQLPLGVESMDSVNSAEPTEAESVSYTEYIAEIPEITPAEASMIIQAEDCELNGNLKVSDERKGFKGDGYVTGFKGEQADYLVVPANIPVAQHYNITLSVASDIKVINSIMVNGNDIGEFVIEDKDGKFTSVTFYGIYIDKGAATIQVNRADNEFDIDYIKIENNEDIYEDEFEVEGKPVSEKTSYEMRDVLRYFKENLGKNIITGQFVKDNKNLEIEYIHDVTGKYPVIRFSDIGGYGESKPPLDSELNAAREWNEKGGIVGFMWYWNSPSEDSAVYAKDTKFSLEKAVTDEDIALLGISEIQDLCRQGKISSECLALIEDIDEVSAGFMELAEEGIPILWRPLHEAGGGWYWWGASGGDAYIWLYELMFDRMTKYHQLDNLIWIWNGQNEEYLVDEDKYDIAAMDIYIQPNNAFGSRSEQFQLMRMMTDSEKMLAISECSGVPGISEMLRDKSVWSFFGLWYGNYLKANDLHPDEVYTTEQDLIRMYNAENSITLDEYARVYGHE